MCELRLINMNLYDTNEIGTETEMFSLFSQSLSLYGYKGSSYQRYTSEKLKENNHMFYIVFL